MEFQRSRLSPEEVRLRRCLRTTSMVGELVIPRAEKKV
jgi:hypothetical protein